MNDTPRRLRLALIASGNPEDVGTWSGTPFHMLQALREVADVHVIRRPWHPALFKARMAARKLTRGWIDAFWSPAYARLASAGARAELARGDFDAVVAVGITQIAAQLVERYPVVFVSDATFSVMADYYPLFRALDPRLKRAARAAETKAISRAVLATFPSDWAAASAVRDHGARPERVAQIEWGANMLARDPIPPAERRPGPWRLFWAGIGFEGKGGWIAIKAVQELRARGFDITLDMAGPPPEPVPEIPGVTFHGRLRKSDPGQRAELERLFRDAHLFVLPTAFDCFPTVIAEAASFGLPSIAYRTGGLESNVLHGRTGLLLDPGAPPEAWADAIAGLISDQQRYLAMAEAALRFSHERLNWRRWAATLCARASERLK